MTARRFEPSAATARRRNLLVAGLAGLCIAGFAWLAGFESPVDIVLAGLTTAALTLGAYTLIYRLAGPAALELDEVGLAIEHKGRRIRLPWHEVTHVSFGTLVVDHVLIGRRGGAVIRVPLEGYDRMALAELGALFQARVGQPR
ncbi:MAG: hypothetical protein MUF14_08910 [Hyphomonadaceae bacterium]|jgi:hypothetical protein|nr:hypothetical protein [Hyphomonadaceae bacterium]